MGVVIRQSFISSALTYVGAVVGFFNVLWLYPKFFNDLDEIGLFRVITDTAILLVPFAQMGLSTTLVKFFPHFKNSAEKIRTLLNTFLVCSVVSFLLFCIIFYLFEKPFQEYIGKNSPEVIPHLKVVLALIFVLVITGILESYSRSLLKIIVPNFLKEVLIRVLSAFIVTLYFLKVLDINELLISLVLVYATALMILFFYLGYLKQLSFKIDIKIFDRALVKSILQYSLFAILSSGSGLIVMKVDSIMVAAMLGLNDNAIYTTAFYIATVIEMPRRSISQILLPLVSSNFSQGKNTVVESLYRKSSINLLIIGVLLFLGIVSNLDSLYFLIPKWQEFAPGKVVVIIIGVAKIIDMVTGVNGEIIIMSRYYKFYIIAISLLAVFIIISNYYLIPAYGLAGAAAASLLSVLVFNLSKLIFIKVKFNMQPFTVNTLKVLLLGAAVFLMIQYLPRNPNPMVDIFIRSSIITFIYCFAIIRLKISEEVDKLYQQLLRKIIRK